MKKQQFLGIYQGSPPAGDKETALSIIEKQAKLFKSSALPSDFENQGENFFLLIFSEMFLTGYRLEASMLRSSAEVEDGPSFQRVRRIAIENRISILYGFPEREKKSEEDQAKDEGFRIYNSLILVDELGNVLVKYRKTHLYGDYYEKKNFAAGNMLAPVVSLSSGLRVGVLICFDFEFPEPTRVLALQGAQLIAVPTANTSKINFYATATSRAFENQVFVAYVNALGCLIQEEENQASLKKFSCGESCVIAPDGSELARISGQVERLEIAKIDPDAYQESRRHNPMIEDRRPELYSFITKGGPNY